jgi:hypothetical protein
MVDYETVKREGEKYSLPNITQEEFEKHGGFSSIITILTRIRNSRQDTAKRVQKEERVRKEVKTQSKPRTLAVSKREGPGCPLEKEVKPHCSKFGFDCEKNCWMRIPGSIFAVEGLTVTVECKLPAEVNTKPEKPEKKGLLDW